MTSSLRVREVNFIKHEIDKYVIILIYLLRTNTVDNKTLTFITKELHLIDDLKAKMLINNDVLRSKEIFINIA